MISISRCESVAIAIGPWPVGHRAHLALELEVSKQQAVCKQQADLNCKAYSQLVESSRSDHQAATNSFQQSVPPTQPSSQSVRVVGLRLCLLAEWQGSRSAIQPLQRDGRR